MNLKARYGDMYRIAREVSADRREPSASGLLARSITQPGRLSSRGCWFLERPRVAHDRNTRRLGCWPLADGDHR